MYFYITYTLIIDLFFDITYTLYIQYRWRFLMATTLTIGNFKGGVGKTKMATMLAFDNALIRNKKTLVLDLDPQGNATKILARTGGLSKIQYTITDQIIDRHSKRYTETLKALAQESPDKGIQQLEADPRAIIYTLTPEERAVSLDQCIYNIRENLDMIGCDTAFRNFPAFIRTYSNDEQEQVRFIANLINDLKKQYDTIFIDVPPTISEFSDNAMAASDYSIIAFQTQDESFDGVNKYIGYQNFMVEQFNINLQVIAIVACMVEPDDNLDQEIYNEAKEAYGDVVADTIITHQKRLKRYSREGIDLKTYKNGNFDQWDFKAHNGFNEILGEIESRDQYLKSL
ncbi:ParA family protein (plasmid) [Latilactobacillus curvatus]|nr:ParA family protein [Latilactobacillus curvatus]PKX61475.1 ParA family protein [Latilactobacillus sakei]UNC18332.1 ParA family protein [Latilactobacillus sakei]